MTALSKHIGVAVFVTLAWSAMAVSQTLDEFLIIAARNNPGLNATFQQYQAALEKVPQVGALPDPQVSFGIFISPMERYVGNQVAEISLMQMFPWFGTLAEAKNEAALMAKSAYEEFQETKSRLYYEVKVNWYAMALLEKEIAINAENVDILKALERLAINRFQSGGSPAVSSAQNRTDMSPPDNPDGPSTPSNAPGNMSMPGQSNSPGQPAPSTAMGMTSVDDMAGGGGMIEVLRVRMEINELNNRSALLEDSRSTLLAQFNALLDRPGDQAVRLPDNIPMPALPVPISEIPELIRQNNPLLKMLEQEEGAFLARENMGRKMGFPMIGIGLEYNIFNPRENSQSMMNGDDMLMPMVSMTLPLWRSKYNASVREAGFLRESARARRNDLTNQLNVSYEEALKDFNDANRRFDLYNRQTELARQALNILTVDYTTGGSGFEDILRMQQKLLDYRLKTLAALVDGNVATAMIERLMGR